MDGQRQRHEQRVSISAATSCAPGFGKVVCLWVVVEDCEEAQ